MTEGDAETPRGAISQEGQGPECRPVSTPGRPEGGCLPRSPSRPVGLGRKPPAKALTWGVGSLGASVGLLMNTGFSQLRRRGMRTVFHEHLLCALPALPRLSSTQTASLSASSVPSTQQAVRKGQSG